MKKNMEVLEQIKKENPIFMMDITTAEMSIDLSTPTYGGQRIFPNWKFKKVKKC